MEKYISVDLNKTSIFMSENDELVLKEKNGIEECALSHIFFYAETDKIFKEVISGKTIICPIDKTTNKRYIEFPYGIKHACDAISEETDLSVSSSLKKVRDLGLELQYRQLVVDLIVNTPGCYSFLRNDKDANDNRSAFFPRRETQIGEIRRLELLREKDIF